MRSLLPITLLLALPLAAAAGQPPRGPIRTLAEQWSGGQTSPRCHPRGPRGEVLGTPDARHCEWTAPPGSRALGRVTGTTHLSGGPSSLTWERPTRDAADADRVIDSLGTALVRRGLRQRSCGEGEVPAGRVRGTLWEGTDLVVHLSRIGPAEGPPRLYVVATDEPRAMPTHVLCPTEPRAPEPPPGGGRVMVGEGLAELLRPDALMGITRYEGWSEPPLSVLRYRTGRPVADSAEVRRILTEALARTRGFEMRGVDGRTDSPHTRLIVRPCYVDHCPRIPPEEGKAPRPGDLHFVPAPDGSWRPAPAGAADGAR